MHGKMSLSFREELFASFSLTRMLLLIDLRQ